MTGNLVKWVWSKETFYGVLLNDILRGTTFPVLSRQGIRYVCYSILEVISED
jgi:hypothetical protein|tara:strand:- start:9188 stop:9343 length:156 start_codon:yes stop_codon:yes gene_type:complete